MQAFASSETVGSTKVIIHYQEATITTKDWNLWVWPKGKDGQKYELTGEDEFGRIAVNMQTDVGP
ncbi:pullulanase-associated domain-containing protein [Bacillus fonticola]|uniref:pullulanase-associated domain-containing protein n=1 Tax=Bacillus fonticola TaxID=2728853 RepID=UPI001D14D1B2|nr:pullulanase-associated domain-containing protein [Bacillus fonticola]